MPFGALKGSPSWLTVVCVGVEHHSGDKLALYVDDGRYACDAQGVMNLGVVQMTCLLVMSCII